MAADGVVTKAAMATDQAATHAANPRSSFGRLSVLLMTEL